MSVLCGYIDKKMSKFLTNRCSIEEELDKYNIKLLTIEFDDISKFTNSIIKSTSFNTYSIDVITTPITLIDTTIQRKPISSVILKGSGKFIIQFDDYKIELKVNPGDFITIPRNIKHCFKTIQHMAILNFK